MNRYGLKSIITLVVVMACAAAAFSQQHTKDVTGNWLMYFGSNRISDEFSIHTEIQYRNHEVVPNTIEQLLIRAGLNYHFSENAFVTAGYGYIPSYDYLSDQKAPESREHRIWQQLITTQKFGRVKLEHRYRVEQRWVNDVYSNRLRYRIMAFVPLNNPTMDPGTFFLGIYDEIFLKTEQVYFDINRLYGALGYQLRKDTSVQVGFLRQQKNLFGKNYLQFAVAFNPDFRK